MKDGIFTKLTVSLIAITLLLSILFTMFVKPGCVMESCARDEGLKLKKKQKTEAALPEEKGRSREVSIDAEGLKIFAPENTFEKKNPRIKVKKLIPEQLKEFEEKINAAKYKGFALFGWNVDAGMKPDEIAPGEFTMTTDLKEQGVPEEDWGNVAFFRIDDDGNIFTYAAERQDNIVTIRTNRNSVSLGFLLALPAAVYIGLTAFPEAGAMGFGRYMEQWKGEENEVRIIACESSGSRKEIGMIRYTFDDSVKPMVDRAEAIKADELKKLKSMSSREINEGVKRLFGKEEADITQADINSYKKNVLEHELKSNYEYTGLQRDIKKWKEENFGKLGNDSPRVIGEISDRFFAGYRYLKHECGGLKMPGYSVHVVLSKTVGGGAHGVTTTNPIGILKDPFIVLNMSRFQDDMPDYTYDHMLLTLTHELFHVCQREYKHTSFSNLKFDEATAQIIELEARKYFRDKGQIKTNQPDTDANYEMLQYFALPLDEYSVEYPSLFETEASFSCSGSGEKADSGYPLARFIQFLNREKKKTMHEIGSAYCNHYLTPSFTELMETAFGLSDETLTAEFHAFARSCRGEFVAAANKGGVYDWAFPVHSLDPADANRVTVKNHDYTVRVHKFLPKFPENYDKSWKLLIANHEQFRKALPDVELFPDANFTGRTTRYGYLSSSHTGIPEDGFSVVESDGGVSWFGKKSELCALVLTVPSVTDPVVKRRSLQFKMPKKSPAGRMRCIDGYEVIIKSSEGTTTTKRYKLSASGKTIKIPVKKLVAADYKGELNKVVFDIACREYIKRYEDGAFTGEYDYGPGGDMIDAMYATLIDKGAKEGAITVSLGWQTKDDLDLHVTTPHGKEIFFSNPNDDGGELDVDMQIHGDEVNPAEHIVFAEPCDGEYTVEVNVYTDRTEDYSTPYVVVVQVGDQKKTYNGAASGKQLVCKFVYEGEGEEQGGSFEDN